MTETLEMGVGPRSKGLRRPEYILAVRKDGEVKRHRIEGTVLLGRSPENNIVIQAAGVSRYHLEIRVEPDALVIRDVGSRNGTFYNGARITEARVGAGAVFRLGPPGGVEVNVEVADQERIEPSVEQNFGDLIGRSPAMRGVFAVLERTAKSNATILLLGETGTGKEVAARAIHANSPRKEGPFVVVDCGSLPNQLIESELFGHVRGAFTDAKTARDGAFILAHGGTLFLDEIGELPLDLQPKLLRAVESRTVQPLGDTQRRSVDVRVIAATHRDLEREVEAGRFRRDLFFRLAVVTVRLPPLRERADDVLLLAKKMLDDMGQSEALDLSGPLGVTLLSYPWPGNVRELKNAIERAVHLGAPSAFLGGATERRASTVRPKKDAPAPTPPEEIPFKEAKDRLIDEFERAYVERLMKKHEGNISAAARTAGIDRNYLYRLLKKHGLG